MNHKEAIEKANAGGYSWWANEVFWSDAECFGHPSTWAGYLNREKDMKGFIYLAMLITMLNTHLQQLLLSYFWKQFPNLQPQF